MKLGKTVVIPLVGVLLLVGAGAVLATTSNDSAGAAGTVPAAAPTATPAPATGATPPVAKDTAFTAALDSLVAKGTITAAQKQAILDAVAAERATRRQDRQADRQQLRAFLADGVITKAEFDQLPADSPLRKMTNLMADGQITKSELRALGRELLGGGRGGMFGGKGPKGPAASPAPSSGTSG